MSLGLQFCRLRGMATQAAAGCSIAAGGAGAEQAGASLVPSMAIRMVRVKIYSPCSWYQLVPDLQQSAAIFVKVCSDMLK